MIAIVPIYMAIVFTDRLITNFTTGLATHPLITLVDAFVFLYVLMWLVTVASGPVVASRR